MLGILLLWYHVLIFHGEGFFLCDPVGPIKVLMFHNS